MATPNADVLGLDELLCVARALTAIEPVFASESLASSWELLKLRQSGTQTWDVWIETMFSTGPWYTMERSTGEGNSLARLPDGEQAAIHIDVRGDDGPIRWLREKVEDYAAACRSAQEAWDAEMAAAGIAVDGTPPPFVDPALVEQLEASLRTADSGFRQSMVRQMRSRLSEIAPHIPDTDMYLPGPEHLVRVCQDMTDLRWAHGVDGLTAAAISGACALCCDLPACAGPPEIDQMKLYVSLVEPLVASSDEDPMAIFGHVIRRAIAHGLGPQLLETAQSSRQSVAEEVEGALDAPSLNDHLEILYRTIPRAEAAMAILQGLAREENVDEALRKQASGAARAAEETGVRLTFALHNQMVDLAGFGWQDKVDVLRRIREAKGQEAVEAKVHSWIEDSWLYPRSSFSALLEA